MKYINARRLRELLVSGSRWLAKHSDILDTLNVYPVPDGDTGTNMSMTVKEIEKSLKNIDKNINIDEIAEIVSEAVMLGARGNSGTILSQIVHGFLKGMLGKERIYAEDIAAAIEEARKSAYSAVTTPVEGTILTIIRRLAEESAEFCKKESDLVKMMGYLKKVAADEVEKTQETLPKLKEAGVVDAGAKGFYYFLEGFEKVVKDELVAEEMEERAAEREFSEIFEKISAGDIKYRYCTEFLIESDSFDLESYKEQLGTLGDSIVTARITGKTKTHVHTNSPGVVLELAMKHGELNKIKIENMAIQHSSITGEAEKKGEKFTGKAIFAENCIEKIKFISVADTQEMGELFIKKGAAAVIIGGQSNNPSVADIESVLSEVKGDKIYFLPNNKNIIPVAKIAQERSNGKMETVESKTMCEGYFYLENRYDLPEQLKKEAEKNISVEVTNAVRDTTVDGKPVKNGDYILLVNGKIKHAGRDIAALYREFFAENSSLNIASATVFKGKEKIKETNEYIEELKSKMIVEEYETNQENYSCYFYFQTVSEEMAETAIVTDSTADIKRELYENLPVAVVPLKVKFSDSYYKERVEISGEEFWEKLMDGDTIPKTSQPAPMEFQECYNRLLKKGYKKIVSIHLSGKLSGTVQSAAIGKKLSYKPEAITVIDGLSGSMGQGRMVLEAAKKAVNREDSEAIYEWVEAEKKKIKIYFIVNDIKYLQKGGRIGKAASVIGSLLKIKPVLHVQDGEVIAVKKAVGEHSAIEFIKERVKEVNKKSKIEIIVGSGGRERERELAEHVVKEFEKAGIECQERFDIGAVIGSHTGAVTGVIFWEK